MKTLLRYSLIIITLGLFSSCAEQFREIRGTENRGNAFLAGGLTSSTATKRTDKAKGETVTPQQTVISVEQVATAIAAESTPNPNPIEPILEKVETNPTSVIQGQKSNVSGKIKKDQIHSFKKSKLLKPAKFLKQAISQGGNGTNGFLMTFGILGIIGSGLGILLSLIFFLYVEELSFLILGLFFLLTLISSIWLVASPTLEDAKELKIAATVLSALGLLLGLISWIMIFTVGWY